MNRTSWSAAVLGTLLATAALATEPPPLLPEPVVRAIAAEVSGTAAKRNLQDLTLFHRMRGSRGFRAAAERVRDRAREYGLSEVEILELPADGTIFYGTQRSRPAWDVDFAELWEQRQEGSAWVDGERIASWEARPIVLAQDSATGRGRGRAGRRRRRHRRRRLSGQGRARQARAHLLPAGRRLRAGGRPLRRRRHRLLRPEPADRLVEGGREPGPLGASRHLPGTEDLRLHGLAEAGARLAGAAGRRRAGAAAGERQGGAAPRRLQHRDRGDPRAPTATHEIVLSCHLDHQRPGANDNASGCATILEVGRTLAKLVREGKLAAAAAHDPLRLAAGDRGHDLAPQRPAGHRGPGPRRDPHGHGGRRRRDHQGGLPRHPLAEEPADLRQRRGRRLRPLRQRAVVRPTRRPAPRPIRWSTPRGASAPSRPSSSTSPRGAITRCGARGRGGCRRSTSTTGRTATSTPTPTASATSIRPSCCAPPSSAPRAPSTWPGSTLPRCRRSGRWCAAAASSARPRRSPAPAACGRRGRRRRRTTCCASISPRRPRWWSRSPASPRCRRRCGRARRRSWPG